MKKVILITLLLSSGDVYAQGHWWPVNFDIEIPAIIEHTAYSNNTTTTTDTATIGWNVGPVAFDNYHDTNYQVGDTVSMTLVKGDMVIHFIIDTLNKELKDFSFEFAWDHSTGSITMYQSHEYKTDGKFIFSVLHYKISGDSLYVFDSGALCKSELTTASLYYIDANFFTPPRAQHTQSGYQDQSIKILDDTSKYKCILIFVLEKPVNTVSAPAYLSQYLSFSTSLPDHIIHFSFPPVDHAQRMTIHDLLGREVSRIEIPAGSSSYLMYSAGYPKGTYFVRLGLQTASFIVN